MPCLLASSMPTIMMILWNLSRNCESYQSCPCFWGPCAQHLSTFELEQTEKIVFDFPEITCNYTVRNLVTRISLEKLSLEKFRSTPIFFQCNLGQFQRDPMILFIWGENSNNGNRLLLKDDLQCLKLPVGGGIGRQEHSSSRGSEDNHLKSSSKLIHMMSRAMLQTHFFHQNATFFTHHGLMTTIRGVAGFLLEDICR